MHISVPRTTRMRKRSGRPLDARPWETTATYTAAATSCFWQMSEIFRKTCLGQYGLDPGHYYISPGLSWDALLKKTGVELELLTDYDQHLFIEKGMRGGISMVPKRHAKANNPLVEGCDPEMPSSHIQYWTWITSTAGRWASPYPRAPSVGRGQRAVGQNHCRSSSRRSRGLHLWGGSGIPRRAAQGAQRLPTSSRAHDCPRRVDVRVPAQPPRRWGGANWGWKAGT